MVLDKRDWTQKGIETKSIEAGQKVLINTNTYLCKCIENNQDPELENVVTQMREWESEHEASETN